MNNWNEFEWESELRVDDKRIYKYMTDISKYIDLPQEEEIILKRIVSDKSLASHQTVNNTNIAKIYNDLSENDLFMENWDKREGAEIYIEIEKLASVWSTIFVSKIKKVNFEKGLSIICRYGKLLARLADLVELSDKNIPSLKIAISKRVNHEINSLLGDLNFIANSCNEIQQKSLEHAEHLKITREKVLNFIQELKTEPDCPF